VSTPASKREIYLHWFFTVSLVVKAALAASEILAAIGALVLSPSLVANLVQTLVKGELAEDSHDLIANYLLRWAANLSINTQHFLALYLLSHGAIKLWLIVGLLRERLWYYPAALVIFGLFIVYQLYRFNYTHSIWLLVVTAVDLVVVGLTWHEYGYLRYARQSS
jgi:uncharacterized membrane protein